MDEKAVCDIDPPHVPSDPFSADTYRQSPIIHAESSNRPVPCLSGYLSGCLRRTDGVLCEVFGVVVELFLDL